MGYDDDEVNELNLPKIIHPDSQNHCSSIFNNIMEHKHDPKTKVSFQILTKTKETILLEGSLSYSVRKGEVISVQGFFRDITKRTEAENLLKKSEANFRKITETINDVFYLYNIIDKKYEYISPNIGGVLGANQEFFYSGRSHTKEFGHPEDIEILKKAQEKVEAGKPYNIEYRITINNEIRWINEKSFPIQDDLGNIVSNSGICRDITDVKIAQETIRKQNLEIESGILYAKRIQDAVLPNKEEVIKILPDSFILYYPKDVLSGDFYIVDQIIDRDGKSHPTFIVADCTGHGVPGGILSLLCNRLIKESFTNKKVNSPSDALNSIRKKLNIFFKMTETNQIQDGMDVSFCVLNKEENILHFSGANSSCILIRNGEIIEYKGDRQHIGFSLKQKEFTNYIINVQVGDCIYLYSDGIVDQFGGPDDKKFMRRKLHQLLSSYHGLPMSKQSELLKQEFFNWKEDTDQTDDITVLGVRIS